MADEEKNDQQNEETPAEETPEQAPEAEDKQPDAEGGNDDASKEVEAPAAADAEEASADEAGGGEDASSDQGGGEDASSDEADASGDDQLEGLDWKARRRLERSRRPGDARPQVSPEERAAARAERRAGVRKVRASYRRKRREKHEGGSGTPPADRDSVARKMRQGTVVSNRADKTITVRIDVARRHPVYEKIIRSSNTLHAHDERNEASEGDLVRIVETRPISRSKRWRLVEVLEKAK